MKFCPKCGTMLIISNGRFKCTKCGHEEGVSQITVKEKMPEKKVVGKGALDSDKHTTLPVVEKKCPKCDNMKSYSWQLQMRAGDEGETAFFKCLKCKHTWRENR